MRKLIFFIPPFIYSKEKNQYFFVLITMSESDTTVTNSSIARSSVSTSCGRKKRKNNPDVTTLDNDSLTPTIAGRANKSHTSYFFHKDPDDIEIAYCIICERNPNTTAYPYSRKGGSTSNMSNHLRDKHGITRFNYSEYLDGNNEVIIKTMYLKVYNSIYLL